MKLTAKWITSARDYGDVCPSFYKKFSLKKEIKSAALCVTCDGRLLEWNQEFKETEPGHRHLSHLYGLYPSYLFNPTDRPEQYKAAKKSLDYRIAHDGGCTGWSTACVTACYARLGENGFGIKPNVCRVFNRQSFMPSSAEDFPN